MGVYWNIVTIYQSFVKKKGIGEYTTGSYYKFHDGFY